MRNEDALFNRLRSCPRSDLFDASPLRIDILIRNGAIAIVYRGTVIARDNRLYR